jgi:tetratricopeptide (TPR) repeat protein
MNGMREAEETPSPELMARRAVIKLRQGDYLAAVKNATGVLNDKDASSPIKHQARRTLGFAQVRLALYREAIETLKAAQVEDREDPAIIARLAEAQDALGQHAEAKAMLEPLRAKDLMPDTHAHVVLARAMLALGEMAGARAEVDAALAQEPDDAEALAMKAKLDAAKKSPPARS